MLAISNEVSQNVSELPDATTPLTIIDGWCVPIGSNWNPDFKNIIYPFKQTAGGPVKLFALSREDRVIQFSRVAHDVAVVSGISSGKIPHVPM